MTQSRADQVLRHPGFLCSSVSAEGALAVTGCGDGRVRVWSLQTFACLHTIDHSVGEPIFAVRIAHGLVASGGHERSVKLWHAADGALITTLPHGGTVRGVAISSQGFVATVGGQARRLAVWRPCQGSAQ